MNGTGGIRVSVRSSSWLRQLVWALALLGLIGMGRTALGQNAEREIVADVRLIGNRTVGADRVFRIIKTRKDTEFSQATLMEDVDSLIKSGLFKSARPREERTNDGRILVTFQLMEHPNLITDIVFKNAKGIATTDLEKATRLRKGQPLDPTLNKTACYEIQDLYKKKGRYFATVFLEEGDKASDQRVVFNVSEGPIVRVRSTDFTGNEQLASTSRLRTQIDTGRAFLSAFGGVFNPMIIDSDCIKLEDYYKSNGYLDARVTRELKFTDDQTWVDVVFHVREGIRYRVDNVSVETSKGNKIANRDELTALVGLQKGEYYSESKVRGDVQNLSDFVGYRGIAPNVQKDVFTVPDQPGLVRVQYEVKEQAPAYVGQIFVVGNEVTQDRVIRRVLGLYPGQLLRYPEIRAAERDLTKLNIFEMNPETGSRPSVTVLDSDSPFKDILVQVKETTTGSLMFGAGINSDAGFVGSVVMNERNFDIFRFPTSLSDIFEGRAFRGAGQELRIEAVPGNEVQRYSISFREPYLFDRPYSLSVNAYYMDRIYNEYTEGRLGTRIGLSHQLTKSVSVNGSLRVENVNVSNVPFYAPQDFQNVLGNNFLMGPRIGLTWDTRDSYLRPTDGGVVDVSYEQIFGDYTFPIFNVEASRYFTTCQRRDGSGKQTVSVRSQFSWAGDDTPVFERFYGGGFRSIRGFAYRGVGPFDGPFAVGGQFMWMNSVEYQIPIMANDKLFFVTFLDSGTVESKLDITNYRVSAGFGLRITVPMFGPVPIALDFGFPIVRAPQDQDQMFSFWIGLFR